MHSHSLSEERRRLGSRALGRLDKQRRVAEAAEAVFREKGYDGATVRLIAARAAVAVGTVFEFAPDKRSLLLLVFGRVLEQLTDQAFTTLDTSAPLIDQFLHIFCERYRFFHRDIDLARHLVQELAFFPRLAAGPESPLADYLAHRAATRSKIATIVAEQQRNGNVDARCDPQDVTAMVIAIHLIEVREWLATPRPGVLTGLRRLRKILLLALGGVLTVTEKKER